MCAISLPIDGSEDEKIHCFQKEGPLSNGREEFTERAAAFYAALEQGAPADENDPFADLEPDIFEEEHNEIVVHKDKPIRTQTLLRTFVDTNIKDVGDIAVFKL